ncbi:NAD-dependent epimerase/dehydratase family protein [Paenibacillus eucommiae]|nr:NAD-dependent epimerase/dehydratase family protein [Paenibacillus eucommiae]
MHILVTGGAGFIGSHLVDVLVEEGHSVVVIDNLSSGHAANVNDKAELYQLDVTDDRLAEVFASFKPEVVYHHAAQVDVSASLKNPLHDANVNILGTIHMLELCRKYQVRKLIYASSAAVYGAPHYLPINEAHPIHPQSSYGISKFTAEPYIQMYAQLYGLDYTILRYANVYGIRQDPYGEGGVISIFIDKLLREASLVIYGDGEQTRDFIYVKDVVSANLAALTRGSGSILNIGSNRSTSIHEIYRMLCEILECSAVPSYEESRPGDIGHSLLDHTLAAEKLGWMPDYSLLRGLTETCGYYSKIMR